MANREFPHDIEAERSLLGAMLISKEKCIDILKYIVFSDYYNLNDALAIILLHRA